MLVLVIEFADTEALRYISTTGFPGNVIYVICSMDGADYLFLFDFQVIPMFGLLLAGSRRCLFSGNAV